jgi:hypothetical protein
MPKVNVFITVDTEHSIGGAFIDSTLKPVGNEKRVFGKIGDKYYGIPLIIDIANRYNVPLTFFLEVLNKYYFGEKESREVCRYIIGRGHDVQLHLHPNYLNFTRPNPGERYFSDSISNYDLGKQVELIKEGRELLIQYGAKPPVAFRAGNFAANRTTLEALKLSGFLIDSSFNLSHGNSSRSIHQVNSNDSFEMEGIFEIPITNFVESVPFRGKRFKALDINGVSFQEMKYVLNQATAIGINNITIVLHSFSLLQTYDIQYKKVTPRWHVIRRFENLCYFLKNNPDVFEVKPFCAVGREHMVQVGRQSINGFAEVPSTLTIKRYLQQAKDYLL